MKPHIFSGLVNRIRAASRNSHACGTEKISLRLKLETMPELEYYLTKLQIGKLYECCLIYNHTQQFRAHIVKNLNNFGINPE